MARAATPSEMLEAIAIERASRRLSEFVFWAWNVLNPNTRLENNWHIGCLCEHLEAMSYGQILSLVVNMPPRCLKSWVTSVFWQSWDWREKPETSWVFICYDTMLAERDAIRTRDLMKRSSYTNGFETSWGIREDVDARVFFKNTAGGSRITTSPRSKVTGFDADFIVTDDPHNLQDINHPGRLREVSEWYARSTITRGNNPARLRRLVQHQRLDDEDLSGYLRAHELGFETLILPLHHEPSRVFFDRVEADKAQHPDPIVMTSLQRVNPAVRDPRQEGEVLHKSRFPPKVVQAWRNSLGQTAEPQLEQRTRKKRGSIFVDSLFRGFRSSPHESYPGEPCFILDSGPGMPPRVFPVSVCRFYQTIDTATSSKATSKFSVCGTFALTPRADLLVFDIFRERLDIIFQYATFMSLRTGPHRWDPELQKLFRIGYWPRPLMFQAIEEKSSGIGLIQQAAADGKPFKALQADSDKVQRAAIAAAMYNSGKIFHLLGASWRGVFEAELVKFSANAEFSDCVDVLSYGAILVQHDKILRSCLEDSTVSDLVNEDLASRVINGDKKVSVKLSNGEDFDVFFDD